jgi:hypothetical protein
LKIEAPPISLYWQWYGGFWIEQPYKSQRNIGLNCKHSSEKINIHLLSLTSSYSSIVWHIHIDGWSVCQQNRCVRNCEARTDRAVLQSKHDWHVKAIFCLKIFSNSKTWIHLPNKHLLPLKYMVTVYESKHIKTRDVVKNKIQLAKTSHLQFTTRQLLFIVASYLTIQKATTHSLLPLSCTHVIVVMLSTHLSIPPLFNISLTW